MRVLLLVLLFAASAAPAVAASPAERNSSARLLSCDPDERSAVFQGDVRAFGKTAGMAMRFTLQTRDAVAPEWRRIAAEGFGVWLEADRGVPRYVFDKGVEGLDFGEYRAVVRYRWRGPRGKVLARDVDRTRPCRQPDTRADLEPMRITVSAGSRDDTRFYGVRVVNAGAADAPAFTSRLDVAGTTAEDSTGEALAPGESDTLLFEAPACEAGSQIAVTVDVTAAVDEADELDNVLTVPCPARAGRLR